jgi:hypothetical protein
MFPPILGKSGIDTQQAFSFKCNIIQLGHVAEAENEEESIVDYQWPQIVRNKTDQPSSKINLTKRPNVNEYI